MVTICYMYMVFKLVEVTDMTRSRGRRSNWRRRGSWGEEGSLGDSKKGAGMVRNSKVMLRWVVSGGGWVMGGGWWYERIAVTLSIS